MNNATVILAIRHLMSRSMWRFFYEMNPEYRIPNLTPDEAKKRGIPDAFQAYMKAREGDWILSASFQKMFIECNPRFFGASLKMPLWRRLLCEERRESFRSRY